MAKNLQKPGKFGSMDSWREHFFPKDVASERIDELSEKSGDLGVVLANSTIDRHLKKRLTKPRKK